MGLCDRLLPPKTKNGLSLRDARTVAGLKAR